MPQRQPSSQKIKSISAQTARRLAITKQHLDATRYEATTDGIYQTVRDIGCLQLDPLQTVARSHTLVVFSRVGPYEIADLDKLIYHDKKLFEYWAHAASHVLTEDYPIHHLRMREYAKTEDAWHLRIAEWINANKKLRDMILREIKRNGPISSRVLTEMGEAPKAWVSSGWTNDRNVSRMLDFLWMQGKIMVAKREGLNKFWDLSERVLPAWTPREKLSEREVVARAAQTSLQALGIGTEKQIAAHYISGRYPQLRERLNELERAGEIERVEIRESRDARSRRSLTPNDGAWKGEWFVHASDIPLLEKLERGEFQGRTVLLSPFDNLVRDRVRNIQFWNFDYKIEIYVPQAKRKYGYYVLPILHNDQLIGRIDPKMDRAQGMLNINAVYLEPNAPRDLKTARAVRDAIEELGEFLDATEIQYAKKMPDAWSRVLR
ncbi:MAG: winged helix-turn-helix domain-containing protein [Chloroflexota bacterium]|nr:MAG: winged helix-turn-helix domain-containing protein [Chloroflexota bacterium]